MANSFTFYIDESGEPGIQKVRSKFSGGASPYMTLGACLIPNNQKDNVNSVLASVAQYLSRDFLHCNKLTHAQKVFYARSMSKETYLGFGVISMKETLGDYRNRINSNHAFYYNKCAMYLLEKLGYAMEQIGIADDKVDIIFEQGGFDYKALRNLIIRCQKTPHHPNAKYLQRIDANRIICGSKTEEPLLQLADLLAHSLYKCVDKSNSNYQIPEPRYLNEISQKFFPDEKTGQIVGFGIKAVHNLNDLQLDPDIRTLFDGLRVTS